MKFESRTISYSHQTWTEFDKFLNQYGDNEWCPVAIDSNVDGHDGFISRVTFTRTIKPPEVQHETMEFYLPGDETLISSFIEPKVQQGWEVTMRYHDLRQGKVRVWLEKTRNE